MNCPKCNRPVLPGSEWCPVCGAKLTGGEAFRSAGAAHIRIGRSRDNDVCLADGMVSRYHAALLQQPDGSWRFEDLSSKNGTFVNGQRITSATVSPDDRVRMGGVTMSVAELLARGSSSDAGQVQSQPTVIDNGSSVASLAVKPPVCVKYIAIFYIIYTIIGLLFVLNSQGPDISSVIISIISIFLYYKLYKLRNWARITFIFCCVFSVIFNILFACIFKNNYINFIIYIGQTLGINDAVMLILTFINIIVIFVSLYYLTRKDVVACFKRK